MRKLMVLVCVCVMCAGFGTAIASGKKQPVYTLPTKGLTVLQNQPDRDISPPTDIARRAVTPGISPTTGLPWQGDYLPMLVQTDNTVGVVSVNGKNIKTAAVGKFAPWGAQYADIFYESTLLSTGATRFTLLYSDCFAQGQPAGGVGPVRSIRSGSLLLRAQWQCALVYSGGFGGMFGWNDRQTPALMEQTGSNREGALFNLLTIRWNAYRSRVKGAKPPSNLNVDLLGLRAQIPPEAVAQPHAFQFAQVSPYAAREPATTVHLDWGAEANIAHFQYDAAQNAYLRYCGPGVNPKRWVAFASFPSATQRDGAQMVPLAFANVIVQRVAYQPQSENSILLNAQLVGKGNADIFIGGHYIAGYWVCPSIGQPTVFFDDQGDELVLNRGKTFIAQMPTEGLCAFAAEP